jgi:hypothetical protein
MEDVVPGLPGVQVPDNLDLHARWHDRLHALGWVNRRRRHYLYSEDPQSPGAVIAQSQMQWKKMVHRECAARQVSGWHPPSNFYVPVPEQDGRREEPEVGRKEGGNDDPAHSDQGRCTVERADEHEAGGGSEDEFSSFCE